MGLNISFIASHVEYFDPHVTNLELNGANLVISNLIRGFIAHDRVTRFDVFFPPAQISKGAQLASIAAAVLPPHRQGKGILTFYPYHAIPEVWSDGEPRLVYVTDPEDMRIVRYLRDRFTTAPSPVMADTHCHGYAHQWPVWDRLLDAPPVAYDSIVCISEALREAYRLTMSPFLKTEGHPPFARLDLVRHGVDADEFQPATDETRRFARRQLGLPQDGTIVTFHGRWTPYTKADFKPLLRAFKLASSDSKHYLLLSGHDSVPGYMASIQKYAREIGMADRLLVSANMPAQVRPLVFAASDVFCFPGESMNEAQGTTVLEAMAAGLPVIVSDWDGMRDMVDEGVNGYKIPTTYMPADARVSALSPITPFQLDFLCMAQMVRVDTHRLAAAMSDLLTSPDLRKRMGDAGRQIAVESYTWAKTLDQWFALADQLFAIGAQETAEEAARRKAAALKLGLPTPYTQIFAHYATNTIDIPSASVRLTDEGKNVISGESKMVFYDDLLPVMQPTVMDVLTRALSASPDDWIACRDLIEEVSVKSRGTYDDVAFHIGLLYKQDIVDITPNFRGK